MKYLAVEKMNKLASSVGWFGHLVDSAMKNFLSYNRLVVLAGGVTGIYMILITITTSETIPLYGRVISFLVGVVYVAWWLRFLPGSKKWIGLPPRA